MKLSKDCFCVRPFLSPFNRVFFNFGFCFFHPIFLLIFGKFPTISYKKFWISIWRGFTFSHQSNRYSSFKLLVKTYFFSYVLWKTMHLFFGLWTNNRLHRLLIYSISLFQNLFLRNIQFGDHLLLEAYFPLSLFRQIQYLHMVTVLS